VAYLEENRSDMVIPAEGCVEIRRDVENLDTVFGYGIYLQCMPCGTEFIENSSRSLFECEACGYTVTGAEANALATNYVRAISSVFVIQKEEKKRRGILWRFTDLFVSRKKQKVLTS